MPAHDAKPPLGIIDPTHLAPDERFLMPLVYPMFPDRDCRIFTKARHLVVRREFTSKLTHARLCDQEEFPLPALPWFIDTIEGWYWNPDAPTRPGDAGLTRSTTIEGEHVGISAMQHCCGENVFGYSFWNASRRTYVADLPMQRWEIPRFMLQEGLLAELKRISTELGLKR
jgi:hypothetical protein